MSRLRSLVAGCAAVVASPAFAACPMSLAVYSQDGDAAVEFRPSSSMLATNAFRMLLRDDVVLDGFVMWTDDPERPRGSAMHDCPEGDVTGEEIAACTAWEGVVYSVGDDGIVGGLPSAEEMAPPTLIFADLGAGIRASSAYEIVGREGVPWDAFTLSGCQE